MTTCTQHTIRYRCRFCGVILPACRLVAQRLDGAMLLGLLGRQHPEQVTRYVARMAGEEEIATVAAEAFEVIEDHQLEDDERTKR